jgi:uncharacterized membrane protein
MPHMRMKERTVEARRQPQGAAPPYVDLGATLLAVLVIGLGAALRVAAVDQQGLWHDELYTLGNLVGFDLYLFPGADLQQHEAERAAGEVAALMHQDRFSETLWRNLVHEGHPPLYLFLVKGWTAVFGGSVDFVRGFSVTASTLAVAGVVAAGRRMAGWRAGLAAGGLLAVSPYQMYFAVEARSYALMALCAAAATWAWLGLRRGGGGGLDLVVWWTAVTAACLTHYFAALYCGLLFLGLFAPQVSPLRPTASALRGLVLRAAPLSAGVAWLPVLRLQTGTHGGTHWTEGRLGLADSAAAGGAALLELLTGPQRSAPAGEEVLMAAAALVAVGWMVARCHEAWARTCWRLVGLVVAHVAIVVAVDQVIDHHTIAVPRYSSSLAIPLTLVLGASLAQLRAAGVLLLAVVGLSAAHAGREIADGTRAPKQMLREVATHLNEVATEGDLIIVSPSGPTLVGVALYLRPELRVTAVPAAELTTAVEAGLAQQRRVWTVQQRLGIDIEPWATPSRPEGRAEVRFAGVDLVEH